MKKKRLSYYLSFFIAMLLISIGCGSSNKLTTLPTGSEFNNVLPNQGKLVNDKPVGKDWVNLISSLKDWNITQPYWTFNNGILHGDYNGGKFHNYAYTKTIYANYELNAVVRMSGKEANSGVCIRINPKPGDTDQVPGYQVDMGPGYWGCLCKKFKRSSHIA